jgi:hypothetical protein
MLPSVLEPDYNLSVDEVFKIYIRYAIEESAGLYPLEWISEPSREVRDASWPSWLPAIDRDPFDLKNEPDGMLRSVFCVDNSEPMILKKESSRPNDLIVSGVLLDSITEVSATFTPSTTSSEMLTLMADLECPCCESWAGTTVADLETQVSLVLLGGISRRARVSHQEALQGYQSFKAYLKEHGSFPGMRWVPSSASNEDKVASKHGAGMANALTFRVAFHTTTGFIGIGPRCTEPGDVVAILYGSRLPIVLRPVPELSKGSYRLLGVSYVYGIMDGEAVRRHKEMGLEDDVFRIV